MGSLRVRVKNYILRKLSLDALYYYKKGEKDSEKFCKYMGQKKIFFFMTPSYGNLGDQAIEVATEKFLKDYFGEYLLIKIHLQDTYYFMPSVKRAIEDKDFVILQGGGNFGSLYSDIERKRRFIVEYINQNPIFSMPSSIVYEDTKHGHGELEKSRKIYRKNRKFTIISRDYKSFNLSQKYFKSNLNLLFPDMVFYLSDNAESETRNITVICMRTDKEVSNIDNRSEIINRLAERFGNFVLFDTRVERDIQDEVKELEIESVLNLFKHAEIVITDRLHAMVFSAITHTPCVAFPSFDTKIKDTYKWIEDLDYINYVECNSIDQMCERVDKFLEVKDISDGEMHLAEKYESLAMTIHEIISRMEERI